jgi:hypothetical protein
MASLQREQNPDVNSYNPDQGSIEDPNSTSGGKGSTDVERDQEDKGTPVPPDATPAHPIEEPPDTEGSPVGDVDDSPKRIV